MDGAEELGRVEGCTCGLGRDDGDLVLENSKVLADNLEADESGDDLADDILWNRYMFSCLFVELCVVE